MDPVLNAHAERLKALGHPARLTILRQLVRGPVEGTPVGHLQETLGIPPSTLSHHLATLTGAGLVEVERQGTTLRHRVAFPVLQDLTAYLWEDCCGGGQDCGFPKRNDP